MPSIDSINNEKNKADGPKRHRHAEKRNRPVRHIDKRCPRIVPVDDGKKYTDRANEEKNFELEKFRAEKEEEIRNFRLLQELETQRKESAFELERSKSLADAARLTHEEELDYLQKKLAAESKMSPASLEKEFMEKSLPILAEAFAKNLNGMQFQVYKSDGSSADSPLLFFINQIKEIFNRERKG